VHQQTRLAKAAARKTKHAEWLLQAGMARANAEVAALMNGFAARAAERAGKKRRRLLGRISKVKRAAASAKKRQVVDNNQNLEEKHRVQASRLLSHTTGEQKRLMQSHLEILESQCVANEKEFAVLRKQHAE
jgi:hypothetical protein